MLNVSKARVSIISDSQNMTCLDEAFGRGWGSASLGISAWLLFVQCLPQSTNSHLVPLPFLPLHPPRISTVSYSPCHKHSKSLVHLPLLIAVEAGLKRFSPCQMCVAAPRVCFYPEPDRRKCLILQSPEEEVWREEERREFSRLGGVKLVAGRQEGLGWVCWLYRIYFTPPLRDRSNVSF